MDEKTDIVGEWSPEASAFLETLQDDPEQDESASTMQMAGVGPSAKLSQKHSRGSDLATANTNGLSSESHSPPQANGIIHESCSPQQAAGSSHGQHINSSSHSVEDSDSWHDPGPSQAVPPNKRRRIQPDDRRRDQQHTSAAARQPRYDQARPDWHTASVPTQCLEQHRSSWSEHLAVMWGCRRDFSGRVHPPSKVILATLYLSKMHSSARTVLL